MRSLLLLCVAAGPALTAPAELPRKDRLGILYSNQVVFDRRGEPLVSVRVTESQREVTLRSPGPLTLLPGNDDGAQVKMPKGGTTWTLRLEGARPGEVRWWTVAERLPAGEIEVAAARREHWTSAGHEVQLFEAGALIGLAGRTLDTRTLSVGIDPRPDQASARAHAEKLGLPGEVISESRRRPGGWIVATEARSKLQVRARDLLWLSPGPGKALHLPQMEWGHGTPKRGRADRSYLGDLYVTVGNDGLLAVVNVLSAEGLLEGVVPSELYPSAPKAALRAQAVAARGQLLAKVGTRHRSDPYLLCAETHCQAYTGGTRHAKRTTEAVRATRGQLLFDAHGLVDTVYSSACGGHSEAFDQMWGGEPKPALPGHYDVLRGRTEPITDVARFIDEAPVAWCDFAKVYRWKKTLSGAAVSKAVNARAKIGPVHTIRALRRGRSGRALAVEYVGDKGSWVLEGSYRNRTLLGRLRSGMWVVERDGTTGQPRKWRFRGGGFGHGVGMCQHGAMGLARGGHDHDVILKHYYRGSSLQRAW